VLENRDQWDKIAIGSYPADVQPSLLQPSGTVIGNPDRYAVPFRSLIPLNVDNLLIVGRSTSFTSLAASSARVIPLGMACGQAAGAAAAQSILEGMDFRQMSRDPEAVARLQSVLKSQNAYLEDFSIPDEPFMSHWAYVSMADLRRIGLMDGGYHNDYRLDEPINRWNFQFMLNGIIRKNGYIMDSFVIPSPPSSGYIISAVASAFLAVEHKASESAGGATAVGTAPSAETPSERTHAENLKLLTDAGLLDTGLAPYFADSDKVPSVAEVAVLLANLHNNISS
jgi:hypothetical protein